MSSPPHRTTRKAFTLIEVTLSIGVVAVGLVAVLAIIPQGLNIVDRAADTATEARISQLIVGEINVTDWDEVESFDEQRRFFDSEGIALPSNEAGLPENPEEVVYLARIEIDIPQGSLPAAEAGAPNLLRVQVHVTDVPVMSFDFTDRRRYRTYSTVVARTSQ